MERIIERIVNAVRFAAVADAELPNVLYIGQEESGELRKTRNFHMENACSTFEQLSFMGMRIIEVRVQSWLHVAHVEGLT